MNEKKRTIEERIASILGRSSYFDIREGVGGTRCQMLTTQDIAAALGWVSQQEGKVGALVLETHYGSTLLHERALRKAWEERMRRPKITREALSLLRFGAALAVRQLAGLKMNTTAYADYAELLVVRRDALQRSTNEAASWMEEVRDNALRIFRLRLREIADEKLSDLEAA